MSKIFVIILFLLLLLNYCYVARDYEMLSPMSGIVSFINTFRNLMSYIHYVDRDNELPSASVDRDNELPSSRGIDY